MEGKQEREEEAEVPEGLRGEVWVSGSCEHDMALLDTHWLEDFSDPSVCRRGDVGCNCCQAKSCLTTVPFT